MALQRYFVMIRFSLYSLLDIQSSQELPHISASLFQCFSGKGWQHKRRTMNLLVVVLAVLVFLFPRPRPQWLLQVAILVLAAYHESYLTRRICGNRGIGVLNVREDLLAISLEFRDKRQVQPLILSYKKSANLRSKLGANRGWDKAGSYNLGS